MSFLIHERFQKRKYNYGTPYFDCRGVGTVGMIFATSNVQSTVNIDN